jgi:GTPase
LSFRREAFVPKGGPDGGDGGKGGDVIILSDSSLNTLLDCQFQQHFSAGKGSHGMGNNRSGKYGDDIVIRVPVGTIVSDLETGDIVADLKTANTQVVVAKGGRGGRGNARFATPTNRAPRRFQEGEPGEERLLLLELKLIADVGLVGLPNSGKSTLISRISNATPKIADYPFTTKVPALGVVRAFKDYDFVVADIPGLIKDAHKGAGMGHTFLRHVERTRLLLHLVDPDPLEEPSAETRFQVIMDELGSYSPGLLERPMIAVITKLDIPDNREPAGHLRNFLENKGFLVHEISAVSGEGLKELLISVVKLLKKVREAS